MGSVLVHLLIFEAFVVVVGDRWFNKCTRSPRRQSLSVVSGQVAN